MRADGDVFYRRLPAGTDFGGCLRKRCGGECRRRMDRRGHCDGAWLYVWNDRRISGTDRAAGHLCSMHYGKISGVFCKKRKRKSLSVREGRCGPEKSRASGTEGRTSAAKGRTAGTRCEPGFHKTDGQRAGSGRKQSRRIDSCITGASGLCGYGKFTGWWKVWFRGREGCGWRDNWNTSNIGNIWDCCQWRCHEECGCIYWKYQSSSAVHRRTRGERIPG